MDATVVSRITHLSPEARLCFGLTDWITTNTLVPRKLKSDKKKVKQTRAKLFHFSHPQFNGVNRSHVLFNLALPIGSCHPRGAAALRYVYTGILPHPRAQVSRMIASIGNASHFQQSSIPLLHDNRRGGGSWQHRLSKDHYDSCFIATWRTGLSKE